MKEFFLNILFLFSLLAFIFLTILREQSLGDTLLLGTHFFSSLLAVFSSTFLILLSIARQKLVIPIFSTVILGLFVLWMGVVTFLSKDIGNSLWELMRNVSFVILFLAVYNFFKGNNLLQRIFIGAFCFLGVVILAFDLFRYLRSDQFASGVYFVGSFNWYNQMGGFLLLLIPPATALFFAAKSFWFKIFWILAIIIAITALLLTQSRGSWVALLLAFSFLPLFTFKKLTKNSKLVFVILIFISATSVVVNSRLSVIDRVVSLVGELSPETRTVSANLRVSVWQNALSIFGDYPILGVGPDAFGSIYYKYQDYPWLYAKDAHSHILDLMAEQGFIGLFLFTIFIVYFFTQIIRQKEKLKGTNLVIIGVILGLLASFFHSAFDVDWSRVSLYMIFWIYISIVISNLKLREKIIDLRGSLRLIYLIPIAFSAFALLLLAAEKNYRNARVSVENGGLQEALGYIESAISMNPFESDFYYFRGRVYENLENIDLARMSYQKAIFKSIDNSEDYYRLGQIEQRTGNFVVAKDMFLEAIARAPYGNPQVYSSLADTYLALGDFDSAVEVLEDGAYERFPLTAAFYGFEYLYSYSGVKKDLGWLYWRLANAYIRQGKKDQAKELLLVLETKLDPANPLLPLLKSDLEK